MKKLLPPIIEYLQCSLNNCLAEETQEHLLQCQPLIDKLDTKTSQSIKNVKYQDIFSNTKKQSSPSSKKQSSPIGDN